jgi:SAM-dependent methyltransferase
MEPLSRLFRRPSSGPIAAGSLAFRCNVCGAGNVLPAARIDREGGACATCGANVRFRSLMAVLTQRLLGEATALPDLSPRPDIVGLGMSDAPCYASRLRAMFNYENTFFHCEPLLDITAPASPWLGRNDFVVSSDVFEHVAPPVQRAFDNLHALLKPGGVAIFSVPFAVKGDTREHYPSLHRFAVREESPGQWVLENETVDGRLERFRDLVFHGGPGSTLEMRLFSLPALRRHFEEAGFEDLRVHAEAHFEFGIFWLHPWSITMSARRAPAA